MTLHSESIKKEISELEAKMEHERSIRKSSDGSREDKLKELYELKKIN